MKNTDGLQKRKYWNQDEAYNNIKRYCAYQERCHSEVRSKLVIHGIYGDLLEELIVKLIEDNFLNEERFAVQFAGGKFRIKGWGRLKIRMELKKKQVSDYCIKTALDNIDDNAYTHTIRSLIEKKLPTTNAATKLETRKIIIEYLMGRGFEYEVVCSVYDRI